MRQAHGINPAITQAISDACSAATAAKESSSQRSNSREVLKQNFQCVYSHTTHSALTAASHSSQSEGQRASTAQPLSDQPMRSQALPTAAAAIPVANQKPHALSSTAAAQHLQQGSRVAS